MGQDTVGSIRRVTLDSLTYDAMADANFSEMGSGYLNEGVPTSGRTMRKMTRRSEEVKSVVLACNATEKEFLKALSENPDSVPMSYETADGSVYRATGWIEFETRETLEGRAAIQLFPEDTWESFI